MPATAPSARASSPPPTADAVTGARSGPVRTPEGRCWNSSRPAQSRSSPFGMLNFSRPSASEGVSPRRQSSPARNRPRIRRNSDPTPRRQNAQERDPSGRACRPADAAGRRAPLRRAALGAHAPAALRQQRPDLQPGIDRRATLGAAWPCPKSRDFRPIRDALDAAHRMIGRNRSLDRDP